MQMKKSMVLLLCLLCLLGLLSACGGNALPEGFNEEDVLAQAENVVGLLSARDYTGVAELFSPEMAAELDAAALELALDDSLGSLGSFESFGTEVVAGGSSESIGDFAVAVLRCKYENGKAIYTISIDRDGNLCGLYMK